MDINKLDSLTDIQFEVFFKEGINSFLSICTNKTLIYRKGLLREIIDKGNKYRSIPQYEYTVFCTTFYFKLARYSLKDFNIPYKWLEYEIIKCMKSKNINSLFFLERFITAEKEIASNLKKETQPKLRAEIINLGIKNVKLPSKLKNDGAHICICAGLLKHSSKALHLRMLLNYAKELLDRDSSIRITILNTNEIPFSFLDSSHEAFRKNDLYLSSIDNFVKEYKYANDNRFTFINTRQPLNINQDMLGIITKLNDIKPDIFMHYGSKEYNESWFVRKIFYHFRPTVYFFSQVNNLVDEENDIYLSRSVAPLYGRYDKKKVLLAPNPAPTRLIEKFEVKHRPNEVKNIKNEIKIVSVLGHDRIISHFKKYSKETMDRICFLLKNENVTWTFIGVSKKELLIDAQPSLEEYIISGKITTIAVEENLLSYLSYCDIFLHLPHFTGGGGGVMMAMKVGLPTLCFENSDAATSILKECVFKEKDISEYFDLAEELINSDISRLELGSLCKTHYLKDPNDDRVRRIMFGLNKAIENFEVRKNKTSN